MTKEIGTGTVSLWDTDDVKIIFPCQNPQASDSIHKIHESSCDIMLDSAELPVMFTLGE